MTSPSKITAWFFAVLWFLTFAAAAVDMVELNAARAEIQKLNSELAAERSARHGLIQRRSQDLKDMANDFSNLIGGDKKGL